VEESAVKDHAVVLVGYPFPSEGYTAEGIDIVGGYNLMQGYILWEGSKHWQDYEGFEQYLLKENDIVMAMDVSGSMLARDLKPDRLTAAKNVASDFVQGRPGDRMGLVIFSGETFTQVPLTTDHGVMLNMLGEMKNGLIDDGTAIGDGLATAVSRLKDSEAISKVVILLTDGMNNAGSVDPYTAAEIAKLYGIRVYTIGVGTYGTAPMPFQTPFGGTVIQQVKVEIDEKLLTTITNSTGGKYFRATSNQKLDEIYSEIDKLERSKIEVTEFRRLHEEFYPLVAWALALLLLEFLLRKTIFKTLTD
jgi:Ca-activated chloride channel family protein